MQPNAIDLRGQEEPAYGQIEHSPKLWHNTGALDRLDLLSAVKETSGRTSAAVSKVRSPHASGLVEVSLKMEGLN